MKPLADAEARRRIREDLDATLFVEAAAGTGKTSELVRRIVALLRSGKGTLEKIVAVTFTEKAAGEMKLRLRNEIEEARAAGDLSEDERKNLKRAVEELELARIGTIHAFCSDILRERPVEAGVDPLFGVAPEDESRRLLEGAFDAWFQKTLADPPEGVRRVLRRRPRGFDGEGPRDSLRAAVANLVEHRDFDTRWRRDPFDRTTGLERVFGRLAEIGTLAARAKSRDDFLARNLAEVQRFVDETRAKGAVRGGPDPDGLEAGLRELGRARSWRWRGHPARAYAKDLPREEVLALRDAVKAELDALLADCDADLAPLLQRELWPVVEDYEVLKQRAGKLDFIDLLLRARDLLLRDAGVRAEYQRRFSHFFVDEFQDTDPLQAEILLLLAGTDPEATDWREATPRPGALFLVGDPKQSIYRFRRADVAIYEQTKRHLAARGAEVVYLTTSFRALPSIQGAVNAAFAPVMTGSEDGSQAEYVALEPAREAIAERPTIVALPVPDPYTDYGNNARITNWRIEESLPDAVGAFVEWLLDQKDWKVLEPGKTEPVRVQARHVCLLFRRFRSWNDDVTRPYVRALEARRVPHVLVGGKSFHDREEVLAIRNALHAIEWPDDELRVYATLRGPLFALGDDALFAFRYRFGSLHPLRRSGGDGPDDEKLDDGEREVADSLALLASLHRGRNRRPIADTIERLLGAVRAHAGIAIWPTGEQALANVLRTIDLARRFERRGATSFRAFAEQLEAEAERGEAEDAPVVEEGTEGVRIMTVHRAKGLEFPVVILADPTCRASRDKPSRHVEPENRLWAELLCGCAPRELLEASEVELRHDAEEGVRIAYVAATRARDLLVAPVVGDRRVEEEDAGWLDVLRPVLYPPAESRRKPRAAPACPSFGEDSVRDRPHSARVGRGASVAPGLHAPSTGKHSVVWWDPSSLGLDVEEEVGLRQRTILEADEGEERSEEGIRAHAQWRASRADALERGAVPSIAVSPVTQLAAARAEAGAPAETVAVEEATVDRTGRPAGKRFGSLVHAVLEAVPLDANADTLRATARRVGRIVGAVEDEVEAAVVAAEAALAHPLLRRAAASDALRRETPVLLCLDDGTLAEGVVDLAFREDDGWTVVDFKTDRELEPRRAEYEAQVSLYVEAVRAATGEPARGVLLVV